MKRLACIILIVTVLVSVVFFVNNAHATTVGGTLTANTEWTQAESPINFNGSVTVGNNVNLTIDPGVTVNLGMYSLNVYGMLTAQGAANNQIVFTASNTSGNYSISYTVPIYFSSSSTPWSDSTCSGSIIQYAVFNGIYVEISDASPKIDNCLFNFATSYISPINIDGGSPVISNNTLDYNVVQVQGAVSPVNCVTIYGGTPLITNNQFEGSYSGSGSNDINVNSASPTITNNLFEAEYGSNSNGITVRSGSAQITNNQFEGNKYLNGIVDSSPTSVTISNNVFTNCLSGITAQAASILTVEGNSFLSGTDGLDIATGASLTITNNLIDSNSHYGINGGGYIDSNTITNNQIGIHNPPTGTISNNNIVGNTVNSITATTANIDAENNWWGIIDTQTINQTIYDAKVDSHLGTVIFVPFLTQPSQTAPAIPISTPIITPVPTPMLTPTPTEEPVITTPTSTPNQYSQSFVYQVSTIINLNLITTGTAIILILAWLIVILGYAAKRGISKRSITSTSIYYFFYVHTN